ncbi:MAG TPA: lamin tail domain-containing protein, partial [Kofleriaceae bacterium]
TAVKSTATGESSPAPIPVDFADIKTGGPRAAALEGVLVSLSATATVTAVDTQFFEYTLTDASSNALVVDDFVFHTTLPTIGQGVTAIIGILALRQSASKLEPRGVSDVSFAAGPITIASFGPALSYARAGDPTGATFPQALTVTLTAAPQVDTAIVLASNNPALTVAPSVTVTAGNTSAQVLVTAVAQAADVTLTATLGVQMLQAHVRVLDTMEAPTTITVSPATSTVVPGQMLTMTAALDLPALGDTQITLTLTPPDAGSLPASVTISNNQLAATFTYTNQASSGAITIDASGTGLTPGHATLTATPPTLNHLVINEIDYDQPGTDATEFVEIYNPTAAPISLTNKALILVNGGTTPALVYATVDLGTASPPMLDSHQYLLLGPAAILATAPATALKIDTGWANIVQNGSPDGVALIDTAAHTLIDALSYEGSITAVTPEGFASPISLVEGAAATATDTGVGAASVCRSPDGTDTDNAASDWAVCPITPGAANHL